MEIDATCALHFPLIFGPSGIDIFLNGFLCWWVTVNWFWKGNSVTKKHQLRQTLAHILMFCLSTLTFKIQLYHGIQFTWKSCQRFSSIKRSHSKNTHEQPQEIKEMNIKANGNSYIHSDELSECCTFSLPSVDYDFNKNVLKVS